MRGATAWVPLGSATVEGLKLGLGSGDLAEPDNLPLPITHWCAMVNSKKSKTIALAASSDPGDRIHHVSLKRTQKRLWFQKDSLVTGGCGKTLYVKFSTKKVNFMIPFVYTTSMRRGGPVFEPIFSIPTTNAFRR